MDIPIAWFKKRKKVVENHTQTGVVSIGVTIMAKYLHYMKGEPCKYCGKKHGSIGAYKRCARNGGE